MAIPGRKLEKLEARGKVRVGEKRTIQTARGERTIPASTDYFVCDDVVFRDLAGDRPKTLAVTLPYETAEDCFSTGLEWWKGQLLACYTHDGGTDPTALRIAQPNGINLLDKEDERRGELVGQGRQPIACRADACPHFGKNANNKECRPLGRLQFFLDGERSAQPLQFETKGWNTIEQIASTLKSAERGGPLNAPGRVFTLAVQMVKRGRDQYPLVTIKEADVPINDDRDIDKADALLVIEAHFAETTVGADPRVTLALALDRTNPGWRQKPEIVAKIKEVGVDAALASMREKLTAAVA